MAYIEKAFHQIVIDLKDRNMLRFLWFDDVGKENPVIVQYQFCRLIFGLTPSPAILTEVINHHITRYLMTEPKTVEILSNGFYVVWSFFHRTGIRQLPESQIFDEARRV